MTYTISTDEPLYQGAPRTYQTFSEAALENGRSRIYLGVHWQFDADDGYAAGTALGQYVARSVLQPLTGDERDLIAADLDLPAAGGGLPADELEPDVIDATLSLRAASLESGTTMIALDQPPRVTRASACWTSRAAGSPSCSMARTPPGHGPWPGKAGDSMARA